MILTTIDKIPKYFDGSSLANAIIPRTIPTKGISHPVQRPTIPQTFPFSFAIFLDDDDEDEL